MNQFRVGYSVVTNIGEIVIAATTTTPTPTTNRKATTRQNNLTQSILALNQQLYKKLSHHEHLKSKQKYKERKKKFKAA